MPSPRRWKARDSPVFAFFACEVVSDYQVLLYCHQKQCHSPAPTPGTHPEDRAKGEDTHPVPKWAREVWQLGGQVGISMFTVAVERGIVGSNYSQETLRKMVLKIRLFQV